MKKVVVFGATGNVGVYFADYCKKRLLEKDMEVIAVGRKKTNLFHAFSSSFII